MLIGIGVAGTLTALNGANATAAVARNNTGAYTVAQNRIDAILTAGPFNPQKTNEDGTKQIPPELTVGTTTIPDVPVYKEPILTTWTYNDATARTQATGLATSDIGKFALQLDSQTYWQLTSTAPAWKEVKPTVLGTLTSTVSDVSTTYSGVTMYMYQATVTVSWQYRGRGPIWSAARNRWEYQVTMNTVRTSDI